MEATYPFRASGELLARSAPKAAPFKPHTSAGAMLMFSMAAIQQIIVILTATQTNPDTTIWSRTELTGWTVGGSLCGAFMSIGLERYMRKRPTSQSEYDDGVCRWALKFGMSFVCGVFATPAVFDYSHIQATTHSVGYVSIVVALFGVEILTYVMENRSKILDSGRTYLTVFLRLNVSDRRPKHGYGEMTTEDCDTDEE